MGPMVPLPRGFRQVAPLGRIRYPPPVGPIRLPYPGPTMYRYRAPYTK